MKRVARVLSFLLVITLIFGNIPISVFAENTNNNTNAQVRVVVENEMYAKDNGAAWEGTLLDMWVSIDNDTNAVMAVKKALESKHYTVTGAESGYITEINGLSEYDGGSQSGWNGFINDWCANEGLSAFTIQSRKLQNGDEITMRYSCSWGADLGSDWSSNDTRLNELSFNHGELNQTFSKDTKEYTLTLPKDENQIMVTPHAINKNFQVRVFKNQYTPEQNGAEYKRSSSIPAADGDCLYIGVGNPTWPSMNAGASESVYKVNISCEDSGCVEDTKTPVITQVNTEQGEWYPAFSQNVYSYNIVVLEKPFPILKFQINANAKAFVGDKELIADENGFIKLQLSTDQQIVKIVSDNGLTNSYVFSSSLKNTTDNSGQAMEMNPKVQQMFDLTTEYLLKNSSSDVWTFSNEWSIIGLSRVDKMQKDYAELYYKNLAKVLSENQSAKLSNSKASDNARVILALTSLGYPVNDVNGFNLLEPLSDYDYVTNQGFNGAIWTLIAFDSKKYEIPQCANGKEQNTREKMIQFILDAQLQNGGFSLDGTQLDTDLTAMAITGLASYQNDNEKVHTAINKALEALSGIQREDGGFDSYGTENADSIAQVIIALTTLNINPVNDERFIKNGNTVFDALGKFYIKGGGFGHLDSKSINQMSTEQSYLAFVSYLRFVQKKGSLYQMSGIELQDISNIDLTYQQGGVNGQQSLPKTGDYINIYLYVLLIASGSTISVICYKRKKYSE